MRHDLGFDFVLGVVEIERGKTLLGGLLEVLHQALIAGVVGDDHLEIGMRLDDLALLLQRQNAPRIGERVNGDRGVLPRLDHFVEIADGAQASGHGQRAVLPAGAVGIEQIAAHQVGGGHVFVAGHGNQGLAQLPGHVFDEAGFAAARGALEHDRQAHGISRLVQLDFVAQRTVIGLAGDTVGVQPARRRCAQIGRRAVGGRHDGTGSRRTCILTGGISANVVFVTHGNLSQQSAERLRADRREKHNRAINRARRAAGTA